MQPGFAFGLCLRLGMLRSCSAGLASGASTNLRISPTNSNYRILSGLQVQLWNDDTSGFHGWFPIGPAGAIQSAWGDKDATASSTDADALDFSANADFRFVTPLLELWNPTTAAFHAPWIDGADDDLHIVWGVADAAANGLGVAFPQSPLTGNFRLSSGGLLQLAHATSGKFHTVWSLGQNGSVHESIGVGES
jgi:hypothetical protein